MLPQKGSGIAKLVAREFLILQQLDHRNVVKFKYPIFRKDKLYIVMQFVRGGNLKYIIDHNKDLGVDTFSLWFAELVLALEYIHGKGIIHRDVKPTNCLIGNPNVAF